jgi:hypothetical protein
MIFRDNFPDSKEREDCQAPSSQNSDESTPELATDIVATIAQHSDLIHKILSQSANFLNVFTSLNREVEDIIQLTKHRKVRQESEEEHAKTSILNPP